VLSTNAYALPSCTATVTATRKFDHGLSLSLHDELHWLDNPERVHYKLGVTVHRCLHDKAPKYLVDCCTPVSNPVSIQTHATHARSCVRKIRKQTKKCARNAINERKLRKQKHCVRCFTQRTQAPTNRNGQSKQPIIEAANQALALLAFFVYATRASHATQAIALHALRLNGNRASDNQTLTMHGFRHYQQSTSPES